MMDLLSEFIPVSEMNFHYLSSKQRYTKSLDLYNLSAGRQE